VTRQSVVLEKQISHSD